MEKIALNINKRPFKSCATFTVLVWNPFLERHIDYGIMNIKVSGMVRFFFERNKGMETLPSKGYVRVI